MGNGTETVKLEDHDIAQAGDSGTAIAGEYGTALAGHRGRAQAGYMGTAQAGAGGIIILTWWDEIAGRRRIAVAYVGENGIEPNVPYRIDDKGRFIRA